MAFKDKFAVFQTITVNDSIILRQADFTLDAEAFCEIYADADAFKWYIGYEKAPNTATTKIILQNQIRDFEKARMYCWVIADRKTNQAIGRIHLSSFDNNNTCANIGYFLSRKYWQQGITSACVAPVVKFGFEKLSLKRIDTKVETNNIGSWKVLEKNGFLREGTLRQCFLLKDGLHDCYLYAKLSAD
ncbi:hypothetical protein FACS1894105_00570 [Clostridia bacterium]|nr:hypothetical protein FACS1894105_00570 [Clostridia bacterium]